MKLILILISILIIFILYENSKNKIILSKEYFNIQIKRIDNSLKINFFKKNMIFHREQNGKYLLMKMKLKIVNIHILHIIQIII